LQRALKPKTPTLFWADAYVSNEVEQAEKRAQLALLQMQQQDGYWWAELQSNVTITAEYIMLLQFLGLADAAKLTRLANYILHHQLENGGWSIYEGDGGDLSTSVEAYFGLKLAGHQAQEPALQRAREFIQTQGGPFQSRVFTRIFLALFGQIGWHGIPTMPVEFVLLPLWSGLSIYELSSWSRATVVPLSVVMAKQPVVPLPDHLGVRELFLPQEDPLLDHRVQLQKNGLSLENLFVFLDKILKVYQSYSYPPLRQRALRKAERWILEHQEESGDWGGIQPAMLNAILALHCLGYSNNHSAIRRGLEALDFFSLSAGDHLWLQSCISPVWDTALSVRALAASGLNGSHPAVNKACQWLLGKQIFQRGDWCLKNPYLASGGWAFEFHNNWYPDIDDSAVVMMALAEGLAEPRHHRTALERGLAWCLGMQSENGGFAAFDTDNTKAWLNAIPFADLKALIDPPTEDVTGRVLEMMGMFGYTNEHEIASRAIAYLKEAQEPDGAWYGRWGVNYIYGTWSVLCGLKSIGEDMSSPYIRKAVTWLLEHQNDDGGWGETCETYKCPELRGQGPSTASQTAWALLGLMAAGEAAGSAVARGIHYLVRTQNSSGRWDEPYFTGTGFPQHFMLRYHLYRDYFPLMALGKYLKIRGRSPHA
jgi:squalene-hopene/tetraprenyl-beta-curcumene cyclase